MNEHDDQHEFEDPALRSAVRRAIGREVAPQSLRAKVHSLMAAEAAAAAGENGSADAAPDGGPHGGTRRIGRLVVDRNALRLLGAAACVALALGWLGYQIRQEFFPAPSIATGGTVTSIPASIVLEVLRAHDNCAKLPDHHKIPGDDPDALREKLALDAGVSVSTVSLGGDWTFKGAGVCAVGGRQAAHLLFARADAYVSVFSMHAPAGCGHGADSYRDTVDKHPVAGFTRGPGLYCVVGSKEQGELTLAELDAVLQKVQASVAFGCMTDDAVVASASAAPQHHHP